uniref:Uncharacterized protein n=1 Tax=Rhizophora mucronata TaxID=61149 RepID=A0A2P2Q6P3_RHIMU
MVPAFGSLLMTNKFQHLSRFSLRGLFSALVFYACLLSF